MKAILVEDTPAVKRDFLKMLQDYCPEVSLVGVAANVAEGVELVNALDFDLLFLDVEMPDGTGFDLLEGVDKIDFQVIFITAHEKYALRAIKFSALDYLLKPLDEDDLIEAVQKVKENKGGNGTEEQVRNLLNVNDDNRKSKIIIRDKNGVQAISISDILHLESSGSYTTIKLFSGELIVASKGLKEFDNMLPDDIFFRCHQSHLINMDYFKRFDNRDGGYVILNSADQIPLASRRKEALLKRVESL